MTKAASSILLIEPDTKARHFAESCLTRAGYCVEAAGSCEEGLAMFGQDVFDLVITEVDLDGEDGVEAVRRVLALDPTAVPIVVTSRTDQDTAIRALEAGARSFLMKPYEEADLRHRVSKALRQRKGIVDARLLLGDLIQSRSDLRQKVAERERFLNHLIDSAPFGIVSTDRKGNILTVNGKAERMYGEQGGRLAGGPLSALFDEEEPGQDDEGSATSEFSYRAFHKRCSGDRFPVLVHVRHIVNDQARCIGRLYVLEDLSEREEMESQLLYAERLSMLGQLAPRVAHELKTPLQIISGHAEIALMNLEAGKLDAARSSVEKILPAEEQMLELVQQMARLGKPEDSRQEELDLAAETEKVLETLGHLGVVKYCTVEREFEPETPRIQGDPAQMEQVLRNLIVNAAQAMEATQPRVLSVIVAPSSDRSRVEVTVADTGEGISPENVDRIFEPFFTTKPNDKGTGLGLPIVKTIVDRHGGTIVCDSVPGEATRFRMSFPSV